MTEQNFEIIKALGYQFFPAKESNFIIAKDIVSADGEICLFVTHCTQNKIKAHVHEHILALCENGFKVILIVNSDLPFDQINIADSLKDRLSALYFRENKGFDFAAWGQAFSHNDGFKKCSLLLLVNDSIVGPLNRKAFNLLIDRLKKSLADVIGATENYFPTWHLQSFFLAFSSKALSLEILQRIFNNVASLDSKELVVNIYEKNLTRFLRESGLSCSALFPAKYNDARCLDESLEYWEELIIKGWPFIKASLIVKFANSSKKNIINQYVPQRLRP